MNNINVYYSRNCPHISRLLTGFHMLEQEGLYTVCFIEDSRRMLPNVEVVEADIGDYRIAFDMGDRWALAHKNGRQYSKSLSAYFARDYTTRTDIVTPPCGDDCIDFSKIFPFGFNYYSSYPGNPSSSQPRTTKQELISTVKNVLGYSRCLLPEYIEGKADYKEKHIKILFYTRLWDSSALPKLTNASHDAIVYRQYMVDEWHGINEARIQIIRSLAKNYGKNFSGGIQHSTLAEKMCPDLILPTSAVRKKSYLDKMKSSDICIGSMGLHKSTGWKTGEYIAAARAIVAERLRYDVPGDFDDGNHYIPFDTVDQCVDAVEKLYTDPDLMYKMKKANEEYYRKYLKPDVQILNALQVVFDQSK